MCQHVRFISCSRLSGNDPEWALCVAPREQNHNPLDVCAAARWEWAPITWCFTETGGVSTTAAGQSNQTPHRLAGPHSDYSKPEATPGNLSGHRRCDPHGAILAETGQSTAAVRGEHGGDRQGMRYPGAA